MIKAWRAAVSSTCVGGRGGGIREARRGEGEASGWERRREEAARKNKSEELQMKLVQELSDRETWCPALSPPPPLHPSSPCEKRFPSFLPYRRRFLTPTRGCLPKHVHVLGSGQILGSLDHVTEREERGEEVPCEQGKRLERREGKPGYPHNARLASSMRAFPMSLYIYSLSPYIYYSATSLPYLSTAPLIGPHRPALRKRCVGRTVARRKEPGE